MDLDDHISYGPMLEVMPKNWDQKSWPKLGIDRLSTFSPWLKRAQLKLTLPLEVTPHSGRAGFATDGVASASQTTLTLDPIAPN